MSGSEVPSYGDLVKAAAKQVGATNARQLADALGYTGRDEDKAVRNWWNGTNAPNYEGTMRLLAVAGWLTEPGKGRSSLSAAQERRRLKLLAEAEQAIEKLREELGR